MPTPTKPRVRKPKVAPLTQRHSVTVDGFESTLRVSDLAPALKARITAVGIPLHAEVGQVWSSQSVGTDGEVTVVSYAMNFSW